MVCSAEGVVEVFEGGAVVLPCTVSIQGNLRWKRANVLLLIRTGGQVLKENTPWKDVISLVGSSNNLSISNISRQRDDGMTFKCEDATGPQEGQQETTVRMLVRIKGVQIEQASEGQVTLTEGTPKTLTCTVTRYPNLNASYSWMVDDGSVTGQGSSYSLTADRSMRSVRCTATNKYSNGSVLSTKEATATLNVLYLDTPSATTPVNVTENETATLRCSAQGNPQPTFEWKMSKSAEVKSTLTVYRIENVQRSAAGEYTCSVTNSVGSRQTTVQLVVQYPPDVTVTYDSISHTITCTADGIPNSYTFSPWEHRVGETLIRKLGTQTRGTSVTHTLPDTLTYADTGDYVCTVTNGVKSGQTGRFYVTPPTPAVFQNHSQTLVIGLGKTETISVPFYARPSSGSVQVKWEKTEESDALESHLEKAGPVRLVVYGQEVSLPGIVTTLTLTNVSPTNEGEYSVTITCNINGVAKTSKTSFYVNVTEISGGAELIIGPIVGVILGSLVGVLLICAGIVIFLKRHKTKDSPEVVEERHMASIRENDEWIRSLPTDTDFTQDPNASQARNYELLHQPLREASRDQTYEQLQVPVLGRNTYENTEVPGTTTRTTNDTSRDNYWTLDQTQSRLEGSRDQTYDKLEMPVRGRNDMYENTQVTVSRVRTTNGSSYENVDL